MQKIFIFFGLVVVILIGAMAVMRKPSPFAETQNPVTAIASPNADTAMPDAQSDNSAAASANPDSVKAFTITGANFSFTPSTMNVKKGDRVKITLKNLEGFHDFKIDEFGVATKRIQAGGEDTVEFTADKTGSFEYYCSVGHHRDMGMKGTLIVE